MAKYFALALALVLFPACDSGGEEETGTTVAAVQGAWVKAGAVERIHISGTAFQGGDTADLCFAPTYEGTLADGADGDLVVTTASNTGTVALEGDRLVVTGTVDDLFYDYNGTYTQASSDLEDCN